MSRRFFYPLAFAAALAGCDTDNPSTPLEEIEGTYVFSELRFDPSAAAIADADVLAQLIEASTNVEIFGSGRTLVRFKLDDEPSELADATATATQSTVRLTASTEADALVLSQILWPTTVVLSRGSNDDQLTAEVATTADLEAFDPEAYAGVPPVPGTLFITLDRDVELSGGD